MVDGGALPDLTGRRVLVPGGTGGVGTGVVRSFLAAGASVLVPTRTEERSQQLRAALGTAPQGDLHLLVHPYGSFAEAELLLQQAEHTLGRVDDVVAPIGGWWAGRTLAHVTESDWRTAFVELATTHMAVLRAALPRLRPDGCYVVVVGDSARVPIPRSGLVSMEQAALLMMQQVAAGEAADRRVFSFVLGAVRSHLTADDAPGVGAERIGAVAVALAATPGLSGRSIPLHDDAEVEAALQVAAAARTHPGVEPVVPDG